MAEGQDNAGLTFLGKLVVFLIIAGSLAGAYLLFMRYQGGQTSGTQGKNDPPAAGTSTATPPSATNITPTPGKRVTLGIAYGTEKKRWLESAVQQYGKTAEGTNVEINLIPMGSLDAARALLRDDQRIAVWSPASSAYVDVFVQEWQLKHNASPIARSEPLALSPMVFVMWEERYAAFAAKFPEVSFHTIGDALAAPGGWGGIANKPQWGLFKFGHTHPNQSNSGLISLVLMAYDFHNKSKGLALEDVVNPKFQAWMESLEHGVSGMSDSTGNMMRDMVLKGPSAYDALFVYENVAIDYLKNAEGRWGKLRIEYPRLNMWNDNPYIILNAPWVAAEQRAAADKFLAFLLSEPVQRESLTHGFRPANPAVPIKFPESPFTVYAPFGLKVDLDTVCEPPKSEVVNDLLRSWERTQGRR